MATVLVAQASVLGSVPAAVARVTISQVSVEGEAPPVAPRFIQITQIELEGAPPPDDPALVQLALVQVIARPAPQPTSDIKVRWGNSWVLPRSFIRSADRWAAFDTTSFTPPPPTESSGFGSSGFGARPFGS